ncbi:MAG TPA: sialidase family protein [Kofleriaceae bacterium]|nr:sialidase family protein [Kofleriaceae bacterium]
MSCGMSCRTAALAGLVVAALSTPAFANGRPPGTSSISFRQGMENEIAVGLTFGLVVSHDGGKSWAWMCEDAIGYSGMYDPHYSYTATGALFASTYNGLRVMSNGCTFDPTPQGNTFISDNTLSTASSAFFIAASEQGDSAATPPKPADFHIYKSTDKGASFPVKTMPATTASWWQTILVAPSNDQVVYLSGYVYVDGPPGPNGKPTPVRNHLLFRSDNGGTTWTKLAIDPKVVTLMQNSLVDIVGIASDDPKVVYMRVELDDNTASASIYRSTDAGVTWKLINHKPVAIPGFLVRAAKNADGTHDVIIATQATGAEISHDGGDHFTQLANAPHINCLVENAAGEVWACTQNYGFTGTASDDAGVMKTTDLATWTKVLRYQDLTDAVTCGAGTPQHDKCAAQWCAVCAQLNCKPAAAYNCPAPTEVPGPPSAPKKSGGGCCQAGAGDAGAGALALGLVIGTVLLRPRRRTAV